MITTTTQEVFFKPSHYFTVAEQLDHFDFDVVEKPFFMLVSEISYFIPNHLHQIYKLNKFSHRQDYNNFTVTLATICDYRIYTLEDFCSTYVSGT
jgi:hypothetical protein